MTYYLRKHLNSNWQKLVLFLLALTAILYALTPLRHPLVSLPIVSEQQRKEQSPSILLLNRQDIYFSGARKELKLPYQKAVQAIAQHQCHSIGLALGVDDWEYPLWVLLEESLQQPFQIKHINVENVSKNLAPEFPDSEVCAVISTLESYYPQDLNSSTNWTNKIIIKDESNEINLVVYFRQKS